MIASPKVNELKKIDDINENERYGWSSTTGNINHSSYCTLGNNDAINQSVNAESTRWAFCKQRRKYHRASANSYN